MEVREDYIITWQSTNSSVESPRNLLFLQGTHMHTELPSAPPPSSCLHLGENNPSDKGQCSPFTTPGVHTHAQRKTSEELH